MSKRTTSLKEFLTRRWKLSDQDKTIELIDDSTDSGEDSITTTYEDSIKSKEGMIKSKLKKKDANFKFSGRAEVNQYQDGTFSVVFKDRRDIIDLAYNKEPSVEELARDLKRHKERLNALRSGKTTNAHEETPESG